MGWGDPEGGRVGGGTGGFQVILTGVGGGGEKVGQNFFKG